MSELLFFILGFIIGSLSGITLLCFLVIGKQFSNEEGSLQKDWVYRRMIFQTTDLNNSNCDEDESEGY